jgi:hypothetical protein
MRARRRRGRHVPATVPSARRAQRRCPCRCGTTHLPRRPLRPWRLPVPRPVRRAWRSQAVAQVAEVSQLGLGGPRGARGQRVVSAKRVVSARLAPAPEGEEAVAVAVAVARAAPEGEGVVARAGAAAAGSRRARPPTTRRRQSRTEARGRPWSGCAAAGFSSRPLNAREGEQGTGKGRSNA